MTPDSKCVLSTEVPAAEPRDTVCAARDGALAGAACPHRPGFDSYDAGLVNRDAVIPEGDYYVTVRDGARGFDFLLGPYTDYFEVLANIARGRRLLRAANLSPENRAREPWFFYGHARAAIGTPIRTLFGR